MPSRAQLVRIVAAAFAFGLFAAWAKGQNTDGIHAFSQFRGDVGNISTPWLLVPFVAGTRCARIRVAALVGLLATFTALVGFYLFTTAVVDLGGHGIAGDLRLEFWGNHVYFEAGLLSGPVFGALGGWWRRTQTIPASIVAGVLLMAEPIILLLDSAVGPKNFLANNGGLPLVFRLIGRWTLSADTSSIALGVYAAEFAIGLGLVLLVGTRRRDAARNA